jgi:pinin
MNNKNNIDRNSEEESDFQKIKSRIVSKESSGITKREQVIAIQSRQNDLERNKRMFGSLLGTLQKFRKEENILKSKEEKREKIEKKLEEQEMQEKIKLKQERETLLASRKRKQLEVKALETKMEKLRDLEVWETQNKNLTKFIKSQTKPEIYWLPKIHNSKTSALLAKSQKEVSEMIEDRRKQVDEEVKLIEEHIAKDCEDEDINNHENHDKNHDKNHEEVKANESENENGKNEDSRGEKRRHSRSYSPEIVKKRILSQVVVKTRE